MRVALIGSRGISTEYRGTETFVEELSFRLLIEGFGVYVICESDSFYKDEYSEVSKIHIPSIQVKGTTISSINDVLATLYFPKNPEKYSHHVDVLYFIFSDSILIAFLVKLAQRRILINPDGIEWRRLIKRSWFVPCHLALVCVATRMYMYLMEHFSCKLFDFVVTDSIVDKGASRKEVQTRRLFTLLMGRGISTKEVSRSERLYPYNIPTCQSEA